MARRQWHKNYPPVDPYVEQKAIEAFELSLKHQQEAELQSAAAAALRRIAHVLNTAKVRWEGDTVLDYISALTTAGISKEPPSGGKHG